MQQQQEADQQQPQPYHESAELRRESRAMLFFAMSSLFVCGNIGYYLHSGAFDAPPSSSPADGCRVGMALGVASSVRDLVKHLKRGLLLFV